MDCSPPVYSLHETSQARILEWVAISFSRGSSQPRDRTWASCLGRRVLYHWATREAHWHWGQTGKYLPVSPTPMLPSPRLACCHRSTWNNPSSQVRILTLPRCWFPFEMLLCSVYWHFSVCMNHGDQKLEAKLSPDPYFIILLLEP